MLDSEGRRVLEFAVSRLHLSVRALHRALRVARTIADLAGSERVASAHLAEAISLRACARLDSEPGVPAGLTPESLPSRAG
jgi:magnesium chelatase family protein